MASDVTYYDPDTGTAYRISAKSLTVRDGIRLGELEDGIARRKELEGRGLIALAHYYPLLVCGTRTAERAVLAGKPETDADGNPILPDEAPWQVVELDEAAFLDLPDWLMWAWYTAVIAKNPQYDRSYEIIKKNIQRLIQTNAPGSTPSAPDESSTEPGSSDDSAS